jgi:hypothetical protein
MFYQISISKSLEIIINLNNIINVKVLEKDINNEKFIKVLHFNVN